MQTARHTVPSTRQQANLMRTVKQNQSTFDLIVCQFTANGNFPFIFFSCWWFSHYLPTSQLWWPDFLFCLLCEFGQCLMRRGVIFSIHKMFTTNGFSVRILANKGPCEGFQCWQYIQTSHLAIRLDWNGRL